VGSSAPDPDTSDNTATAETTVARGDGACGSILALQQEYIERLDRAAGAAYRRARGFTPGIFISYRREDAPGHAGRLYDALAARFGEDQVFMDLSMELGVDFVQQIDAAVGSCRLLVAVVGPRWATIEGARGARRLDDPADFIRVEIEAGLRQADVRVVPVLVQGATMPSVDELPAPLADFARRHALELSDGRWRYDVDRLVSTAEGVLESGPSAEPEPGERATAEDARPPPASGWLQSHRGLAIAASLVALLVGVGAVVLASGGGDGASPKLSELIPANVQDKCHPVHGKEFWLRDHGAVEQEECELGDVGITYGRFRSLGAAQDFVENDFQDALGQKAKNPESCDQEMRARLKAQYEGGDAECYKNDEGVIINWSYSGDPVGVQLYFDGSGVDDAVNERAKVL
jgi:hypothetical protein